jgi:hypothetical protein
MVQSILAKEKHLLVGVSQNKIAQGGIAYTQL